MSGLFGGGGSTPKGVNPTEMVNIPYFSSEGGITPEQQSLADFTMGQGLDATGYQFGESGTGLSTMATQAAGGAGTTAAQQQGSMSDTNTGAEYTVYGNQLTDLIDNINNTASLSQITQSAGGSATPDIGGGIQGPEFQPPNLKAL
jgi:hypothetical protein